MSPLSPPTMTPSPSGVAPSWIYKRQWLLMIGVGSMLCLLVYRFYAMQLLETDYWSARARAQHITSHTLPARRGRLLTAHTLYAHHPDLGYTYALDIPVYHLFADTTQISLSQRDEIAQHLLKLARKWTPPVTHSHTSTSTHTSHMLDALASNISDTSQRGFNGKRSTPSHHNEEEASSLNGLSSSKDDRDGHPPQAAELSPSKINLERVRAQITQGMTRPSRSRRLITQLTRSQRDEISAWWLTYAKRHRLPRNTLFFIPDFQRSYPLGDSAGTLLQSVVQYKDPLKRTLLPIGGLEYYYHQQLEGKAGRRQLMRTLKNPLLASQEYDPPKDGADIYLTLHPQLQALSERIIELGVKRHQAKAGWAIVMSVETGQLLTIAQYPRLDPSNYANYYSDPHGRWKTRVWPIQDAYEPGSVMKPLILALALEGNTLQTSRGAPPIFDPQEWIDLSKVKLSGRKKALKDTSFARYLNMDMALKKSSNIYMARLSEEICARLGNQWLVDELLALGFASKSGVAFPAEAEGMLPRPGRSYLSGAPQWSAPTPHSLAMGHNVLASSLQVACAYASLARGGEPATPTLELSSNPKSSESTSPGSQSPLTPEVCRAILPSLGYVTASSQRQRSLNVWGYSEGGKSGTANKVKGGIYDSRYSLASFVGVVPLKDPKLIVMVCYDEPASIYVPGEGFNHRGSFCAGPTFQKIATHALRVLNIPYDDPYGYPRSDPRRENDKAFNSRRLDELLETFKELHKTD